MELIERYLQSVKQALPTKQQADVIAELRDEIFSQIEAKEEGLGRPLTDDEQAALLKQLGHPWLLAARYRKQQYLISPTVFPIYWLVLRVVMVVVALSVCIGAIATAATSQNGKAAIGMLANLPMAALQAFAWVTLVFVIIERLQVRCDMFGKWDPHTLPKLSRSEQKHPMGEAIAALVFGTIFGVWWLVGLKHQFLIFGPGIEFVHFGPVFQTVYPLFVVNIIADFAREAMRVFRPAWEMGYACMRIVSRLVSLIVLYFLVSSNEILVAAHPENAQLQAGIVQLNRLLHFVLLVVALMAAVKLIIDVYSMLRQRGEKKQLAASN